MGQHEGVTPDKPTPGEPAPSKRKLKAMFVSKSVAKCACCDSESVRYAVSFRDPDKPCTEHFANTKIPRPNLYVGCCSPEHVAQIVAEWAKDGELG